MIDNLKALISEEEWRYVSGSNNSYVVSESGIIVSLKRKHPKVMKTQLSSDGYPRVSLMIKGAQLTTSVHRLVASAFLERSPDQDQVNHKDGVKLNNHRSNLEWCNGSHNVTHAYVTGLMERPIGKDHLGAKLSEDDIHYIRSVYKPGHKMFGPTPLSKEMGVCHQLISQIGKKQIWSHI